MKSPPTDQSALKETASPLWEVLSAVKSNEVFLKTSEVISDQQRFLDTILFFDFFFLLAANNFNNVIVL